MSTRRWKPWTIAELEWLAKNVDQGVKHCAYHLGRNVNSVRNKAASLHLSNPFKAERRRAYAAKFGISHSTLKHYDPDVLDRCADDSARRLILGIGEKFGPESVMDTEDARRLA